MNPVSKPDSTPLTAADSAKQRLKMRNMAIAAGLVLLIVLFYFITIFKLGGNVLKRDL